MTEGSSEITPGQLLAKACTPTSVILAQSQRFSAVSTGQPLAQACTPMSEIAVPERLSELRPGQPLAKVCTLMPEIWLYQHSSNEVSPGQSLAQACTVDSAPVPQLQGLVVDRIRSLIVRLLQLALLPQGFPLKLGAAASVVSPAQR